MGLGAGLWKRVGTCLQISSRTGFAKKRSRSTLLCSRAPQFEYSFLRPRREYSPVKQWGEEQRTLEATGLQTGVVLIAIERLEQQYSINNSLASYSKTVKVNAVARLGWRMHGLLKQVHAPKPNSTTTSPRDTGTSVPSFLRWYLTIPQLPSSNSLGWYLSSRLLNPKP